MLANQDPHSQKIVYRLVVGKKNRYTYAGLYTTPALHLPDQCLRYADTRKLTLDEVASTMARAIKDNVKSPGFCALDKGRRPRLRLDNLSKILSSYLIALKGPKVKGLC